MTPYKTKLVLVIAPPGAGTIPAARAWQAFPLIWGGETQLAASLIHRHVRTLESDTLLTDRPFRAPHHTVSEAGLCGGGDKPRPGEVSLAHGGTLLLDCLADFRRATLETLYGILEAGEVRLGRTRETPIVYPARPALVIATLDPSDLASERTRAIAERFTTIAGKLSKGTA